MDTLIYAIIPSAIFLIIPIFLIFTNNNIKKRDKKLKTKRNVTLKSSKSFSVLIIIFTLVFAVIIILLNIFEDIEILASIILWVAEVALVVLCIQSVRQQIVVGEKIEYVPIFGKRKEYSFQEISKIVAKQYSNGLVKYFVYGEHVLFHFSNYSTGYTILLNIFKEKGIKIEE